MRTFPEALKDSDLLDCLLLGWGLNVVRADYAPVGGGSYHWVAQDTADQRYWVTVDDLDDKDFLGDTRASAFNGLRCAFDTALALRETGLEFVVAPLRSTKGATVEPLDTRHAVAVYP